MKVSSSLVLLSIFFIHPLYSVAPYMSIRSQSVDAARDMIGVTDKINLYDMENLYITGALTIEGTRSFNADAIGHCLFGAITPTSNGSDEVFINVSGSQSPNRGATDWLGDYFGLSTTYKSKLFFKPRVSNIIIDFSAYVGLDEWWPGIYFRVHAPVVASRWNLNFREERDTAVALQGYAPGYFTPSAVPAANLISSASDFFSDRDFPTLPNGVTFEPLEFARFEQTRQSKTALAEIQMALGYNFILCPDYHLGFNFRVYAPTGNRPKGIFLFEPIVGNGKHWEVGLGFTSHYTFWTSCDEESTFGLFVDGNFTHLCRTHQTRAFDLKGKPNSRYMLAQRLGLPANPPNLFANPLPETAAGSTVPSAQFNNAFAPVANLTTLKVNVSSAIQADIAATFNYNSCGLSVDLGYNFWARSCEKISIRKDQGPLRLGEGNVWALKGDTRVFGFPAADSLNAGPAFIPLSATQSTATINSGTNAPLGGNLNPGIDNREFAMFSTADTSDQIVAAPGNVGGAAFQQTTSNDPLFLSVNDIDLRGTSGMSHKIFAHLSYTWCECDTIAPYIGIGGKAEFGPRHAEPPCNQNSTACLLNNAQPTVNCDQCRTCTRCNLSEWGIWIKGGLFWT